MRGPLPPEFKTAASAAVAPDAPSPDIYELWRTTPSPAFLRGLQDAEKVQPFADLFDLTTRMSHPRRTIYAWRDPEDPVDRALISVQVAFTQGVPNNIQKVIAAEDRVADQTDTAAFYTISNWSSKGGSLGKPFLMAVVDDIKKNYPHIQSFTTLSPVPELRNWVEGLTEDKAHANGLARLLQTPVAQVRQAMLDAGEAADLRAHPILFRDMQRLVAFCVANGEDKNGRFTSHDRVAGFHMRNGAMAGALCAGGDASPRGFAESFGFMVNYFYRGDLEANAGAYRQGRPALSPQMRNLITPDTGAGPAPERRPRPA